MLGDFEEIFQRICGYIRINSISDSDYYNIIDLMNKKNTLNFIKNNNLELQYIYYRIDIFILNYYVNYNYKNSTSNYDRVRIKVRDVIDKYKLFNFFLANINKVFLVLIIF